MTENEILNEVSRLVSDNTKIAPPEEQFPHHSLYLSRKGAKNILEGIVELIRKEGGIDEI